MAGLVCIVRHGKAEQDSASGRDADRELSARGRRQAAWLPGTFSDAGLKPDRLLSSPYTLHEPPPPSAARRLKPDRLLSSPYTRARQTARIMADPLGLEVEFEGGLELGESASGVIELVSRLPCECPVIVGHNPQLSRIVDLLLSGVGSGRSELRTGQCAVIGFDADAPLGSGRLEHLLRMEHEG